MSNQKLCWECKEYFSNKYGANYYQPPSSHCHHDEPEEKPTCLNCNDGYLTPGMFIRTDDGLTCRDCGRVLLKKEEKQKEKCWCEEPFNISYRWHAFDGKKANFCPECGRKLETT